MSLVIRARAKGHGVVRFVPVYKVTDHYGRKDDIVAKNFSSQLKGGTRLTMNSLSRRIALAFKKPHSRSTFKKNRKRGKSNKLCNRMKTLRSEMEEISKEQRNIKEGQRQVREKFEAVESECDQLRKETNMIMQQSLSTQIRLAFMFQILKARENQDMEQAANLTSALRQLIARDNKQKA